jgi:hypothetical protein
MRGHGGRMGNEVGGARASSSPCGSNGPGVRARVVYLVHQLHRHASTACTPHAYHVTVTRSELSGWNNKKSTHAGQRQQVQPGKPGKEERICKRGLTAPFSHSISSVHGRSAERACAASA